jgi:hypothetical protein
LTPGFVLLCFGHQEAHGMGAGLEKLVVFAEMIEK